MPRRKKRKKRKKSTIASKLRHWLLSRTGETFTALEVQHQSEIAGRSAVGKVLRKMRDDGEIIKIKNGVYVNWHVIGRNEQVASEYAGLTGPELREDACWPPLETYTMIEDVRSTNSLP